MIRSLQRKIGKIDLFTSTLRNKATSKPPSTACARNHHQQRARESIHTLCKVSGMSMNRKISGILVVILKP